MISVTIMTVLVVDLLATSGDITQTWTSPIYPKLYSNDSSENPLGRPITPEEDSWVGSLLNIGAIIGSIPMGWVADKFGRKTTLLAIAVPHFTSYVIYAFARRIEWFYFGRLINGVSMGAGYAILPMYIAEITEDSNRAVLSSSLNVFWTLGNLLPYAVGPYVSIKIFNLILASIPLAFFVLFLVIGCETPYYFIQNGEYQKAKEVIVRLRRCSDVDKEILKIRKALQVEDDGGSVMDIITNKYLRKALLISLLLVFFQQMSGVNAIGYYMELIFKASGSGLSSSMSSTICGASTFLFSFFGLYVVNKFGQKLLLGVSCFGDGVSLGLLGAYFFVYEKTSWSTDQISWLPIAAVIGFIFFFNVGLSALPWTISSELFPNNVKAVSASAVTCCCWLVSFFVTRFFNLLTETALGTGGTFWLFTGSCLVGTLFTILWVPETKGKSFMDIQELLKSNTRLRKQ